MKMREAAWGKTPEIRTGDPAMKQTTAQVGVSKIQTYAEEGIFLSVDNVPRDVSIGVNKMQQYLRINTRTGKPTWQITDNCTNLIKEMPRLRWATYASKKMQDNNNAQEKIHKKNDHAPDSARYFFTFMPDLAPELIAANGKIPGTTMVDPTVPRYDELLQKMTLNDISTQWRIYEGTETYALEYE